MFKSIKDLKDTVAGGVTGGGGGAQGTVDVGGYRVQIQKQIGEGGFACVFLVKDCATKAPYALKRLYASDKEDTRAVRREVTLAKTLPYHPNIVRFYDASMNKDEGRVEGLILMEYCEGEALLARLNSGRRLVEGELLEIFHSVLLAVAHCHSQQPPIVHRDLKVENVLRDAAGVWKLCDFGSATTKTLQCNSHREVMMVEDDLFRYTTPSHRSPEMCDLHSGKVVGVKSDVWSLGCLLFKMCFLQNAFEENKLATINGNYTIPRTSQYSDRVHDLFKYLFVLDPDQRPTVFDVLEKVCALRGVPCNVQRPLNIESPNQTNQKKSQRSAPTAAAQPTSDWTPQWDGAQANNANANANANSNNANGSRSRRKHKETSQGPVTAESLNLFGPSQPHTPTHTTPTQSQTPTHTQPQTYAQPQKQAQVQTQTQARPSGGGSNDLFNTSFFDQPFDVSVGSEAPKANASFNAFDMLASDSAQKPPTTQTPKQPSASAGPTPSFAFDVQQLAATTTPTAQTQPTAQMPANAFGMGQANYGVGVGNGMAAPTYGGYAGAYGAYGGGMAAPQMTQMGQMGQMNPMGQMAQMPQMGGQMGQMGFYGGNMMYGMGGQQGFVQPAGLMEINQVRMYQQQQQQQQSNTPKFL